MKISQLSIDQIRNILTLSGWEAVGDPQDWQGLKRRGVNGIVWRDLAGERRYGGKYEWIDIYSHEPSEKDRNLTWQSLYDIPESPLRGMYEALIEAGAL